MASKPTLHKVKKIAIGGYRQMGLLPKTALYVMLISLCFVYVYPILHMGVTSLKSMTDLLDPSVKWLPHEINFRNFSEAIPAFICIACMPLTYSISNGIILGHLSYVAINLCCGRFRKLSVGMYILAVLFVLKFIL